MNGLDALVLSPGHPGYCRGAAPDVVRAVRHVDAAFCLDRRLLRPAALRPVGVVARERGHVDVGHPLGRGHVAVQAGYHHAGREAVRDRQRLAVHRHREQRVPAVHHGLHRGARGEPVHRGAHQLVRPGLDPRLTQHRGQAGAQPLRVADVRAADRVGHAAQGDVVLDQRPLEQLVEGERDLPVDHAVDPQLPVRRVDLRQDERGVYPVEARVGRDERREPWYVEAVAGRQRLRGDRGLGDAQGPLRAGHAAAFGQQPARQPGRGRGARGRRAGREEAAARRPLRLDVLGSGRSRAGSAAITGSNVTAGRGAGAAGLTKGISNRSTTTAAAVAARVGSRLATVAVGRNTANTPRPIMPYAIRRVAAAPMTAAKMASTTRIPLTRTSLSSAPNSVMAKFFSHGGVKSICNSPTATTGDPLAPVSPATNCPTPSAVAAASTPATAPSPKRRTSLRLVRMLFIRCGGGAGLAGQATTGQHSKPCWLLLRISVMTAIDRPAPEPAGTGQGATADLGAQIRLVARGDAAAFDAVYDLLAASVFGIVIRVIRDPAQSEEVTQDVLLEVWRTASKFDAERGSATAWVMTMAHRRAVDRVRSVQKESG